LAARRSSIPKVNKRHGTCDSCGETVENLCDVRTTVRLCQRDAKALMIDGAYLDVRVVVFTPPPDGTPRREDA
jgi:hypothetical protein